MFSICKLILHTVTGGLLWTWFSCSGRRHEMRRKQENEMEVTFRGNHFTDAFTMAKGRQGIWTQRLWSQRLWFRIKPCIWAPERGSMVILEFPWFWANLWWWIRSKVIDVPHLTELPEVVESTSSQDTNSSEIRQVIHGMY